MGFKNILGPLLILALLFITLGDRVLPAPLDDASRNTRTSINQFLVGLFPDWNPTNPNERTEKEVDQLEQR